MPAILSADKKEMRALSIRQPYAELILRGDQDGGYAVDVDDDRGGTFIAEAKRPFWSEDLQVGTPPWWIIELAKQPRPVGLK